MFELLLRVLAAYTSASKAWLNSHAHTQNCVAAATPDSSSSSSSTSSSSVAHVSKQEREELCIALIAAQESAIIQLLLEICLKTDDEKVYMGIMHNVTLCVFTFFGIVLM